MSKTNQTLFYLSAIIEPASGSINYYRLANHAATLAGEPQQTEGASL